MKMSAHNEWRREVYSDEKRKWKIIRKTNENRNKRWKKSFLSSLLLQVIRFPFLSHFIFNDSNESLSTSTHWLVCAEIGSFAIIHHIITLKTTDKANTRVLWFCGANNLRGFLNFLTDNQIDDDVEEFLVSSRRRLKSYHVTRHLWAGASFTILVYICLLFSNSSSF